MGKIIQLPIEVINKIAAGEVIERPANVVKELVENSIDANATEIIVEIEKSGKKKILVKDNGEGMSREDAILAVEKHTTSKIKTFEDIYKIYSYGFRGEALSSIASVSKFELLTNNGNECTKITVENNVKKIDSCNIEKGTIVIVKDLFFNLPVRRKYLKSDNVEMKHILDCVINYALVHPEISFKVIADQKVVLHAPKTNTLKDKVVMIFGLNYAKNSMEINYTEEGIHVEGLIGNKNLTKKSKSDMYFFVNNRPVKSEVIEKSIKEGYSPYLTKDEYPFAIIKITLDPELIDPNVHPKKETIIFFEPEKIFSAIFSAIKLKLIDIDEKKFVRYEKTQISLDQSVESREKASLEHLEEIIKEIRNEKTEQKELLQIPQIKPLSQEIKWPEFLNWEYLGQFANTYLIFAYQQDIYIVDQHLIEERYNYETLQNKKNISQQLIQPIIIDVNKKDYYLLKESLNILNELGFEIEELKEKFVIRSVPDILKQVPSEEKEKIVKEIVEEFVDLRKTLTIDKIHDEFLKTIACKVSLKSGVKIDPYRVKILINKLARCQQPYTCPHGRPIIVKFSKSEIDKLFKR
ncbi:MAG: DNA mismatch repair endonuclease MutL [Candidatus Woesearchaeota archaeon]